MEKKNNGTLIIAAIGVRLKAAIKANAKTHIPKSVPISPSADTLSVAFAMRPSKKPKSMLRPVIAISRLIFAFSGIGLMAFIRLFNTTPLDSCSLFILIPP
jgi:hypothetical protein